jgi:hypothetical protein
MPDPTRRAFGRAAFGAAAAGRTRYRGDLDVLP